MRALGREAQLCVPRLIQRGTSRVFPGQLGVVSSFTISRRPGEVRENPELTKSTDNRQYATTI